ncbi:NmrA/HSCARG family protein [Mycobacterium manitobense]|uniref:NmrA/HSCARG family protein n=1 Tax=[Mycobacterium] manitobense TaxID=190147 RepID=A0A9X3BSU7_9MYCO|nr:NmrA/HSCARG family protein [[Mycobacterium] manitobense]MCV7168933.1 NmrA/HSCARG family protein [[Mycobacterium] manitobense]
MTDDRTVAVVGATGAQGGAVVRALLADSAFTVRALTRNADSAGAQRLSAAGAEVVEADLDDRASIVKAFAGVHGAYIVTNYWAQRSPEDDAARSRGEMELAQADAAASAAAETGVAHVIWSTLEDTRTFFGDDDRIPTVEERYKVPHFDVKAEADALFRDYGVPTTLLRSTFYYENFTGATAPVREGGRLILTAPLTDRPVPGIAVDDIGRVAAGIFRRGEFIGETVSIAGDHLTGRQYTEALSDALGEEVEYRPTGFDEFRAQGFPSAVEMGNMFQYYAENSEQFSAARDLELVRELDPQLQSFRDWLTVHHGEIGGA